MDMLERVVARQWARRMNRHLDRWLVEAWNAPLEGDFQLSWFLHWVPS